MTDNSRVVATEEIGTNPTIWADVMNQLCRDVWQPGSGNSFLVNTCLFDQDIFSPKSSDCETLEVHLVGYTEDKERVNKDLNAYALILKIFHQICIYIPTPFTDSPIRQHFMVVGCRSRPIGGSPRLVQTHGGLYNSFFWDTLNINEYGFFVGIWLRYLTNLEKYFLNKSINPDSARLIWNREIIPTPRLLS